MVELRDYQRDLLERTQLHLKPEKARVMMQLPTGGGKTVVASHMLTNWLSDGRKAVWLTHRKELAHQTGRVITKTVGVPTLTDSKWIVGSPAPVMPNGVMILMAQTVSRRVADHNIWSGYDSNDLMVIDEAHHATARGWALAMRYWPGRVVGMTATPWRLSKKEGFDHLFSELVCGPQVAELQSGSSLCKARVLVPHIDRRIQGGKISSTGDYTEPGIEFANKDRPDIMTAGVLRFWRKHADSRQTIIYAVSVGHAQNIVDVFNHDGVSAQLILGRTPPDERAATVAEFTKGALRVLVNVAVATEGFDLPDASCVVIARPTESLALYLQMVGRGLRPKPDGGNCVILDLAGNSVTHGLPEARREWTLEPRTRTPSDGEAPVVVCVHCDAVSPAASHNCQFCGEPLGKDCRRCGKWRSWNRWRLENSCKYKSLHEVVCDLCHEDAHIRYYLPTIVEMEEVMASTIESLTSRVAVIREELQAKVADDIVHVEQPDVDALYHLREEVKQLTNLIDETETKSEAMVAFRVDLASRIAMAVRKSGLEGVLGEPITQLYVDHEDGTILINGKSLGDAFGPRGEAAVQAWHRFAQELSTSDERDGQ